MHLRGTNEGREQKKWQFLGLGECFGCVPFLVKTRCGVLFGGVVGGEAMSEHHVLYACMVGAENLR